jgi:hypothetical protein
MEQTPATTTLCSNRNTKLVELVSIHKWLYPICKQSVLFPCFCTQVVDTYTLHPPEHHEETRSAHLVVTNAILFDTAIDRTTRIVVAFMTEVKVSS